MYFIWRHRLFQKTAQPLYTTGRQLLEIKETGYRNTMGGPDFFDAHIQIGGIDWFGHIEMHLSSKDWETHGHQKDPAYNAVVLHVVLQHDKDILREDGTPIPTLEIGESIPKQKLWKYLKLKNEEQDIPCAKLLPEVPRIVRLSAQDSKLAERLERKARQVLTLHQALDKDWERAAFVWLATGFGFKANSENFTDFSTGLSYRAVKNAASSLPQLEALFLGFAGFLETAVDPYSEQLQKEYRFLQSKYGLNSMNALQWRFGGVRPPNYPTVR